MKYDINTLEVYHQTLQPLGESNTFNIVQALNEKIDRIELASNLWITRVGNSTQFEICGLPKRYIMGDPKYSKIRLRDFAHLYALKLNRTGISMRVNIFNKNSNNETVNVVKFAQASPLVRAIADYQDIEYTGEVDRLCKLTTAWIRSQVECESNDPIMTISLPDLMSDYFGSRQKFAVAMKNRGLVIVTVPDSMQRNVMTSEVLVDLINGRNGTHSTLVICKYDPTTTDSSKSTNSCVSQIEQQLNECQVLKSINTVYNAMTENSIYTCLRLIMNENMLIERYEDNVD